MIIGETWREFPLRLWYCYFYAIIHICNGHMQYYHGCSTLQYKRCPAHCIARTFFFLRWRWNTWKWTQSAATFCIHLHILLIHLVRKTLQRNSSCCISVFMYFAGYISFNMKYSHKWISFGYCFKSSKVKGFFSLAQYVSICAVTIWCMQSVSMYPITKKHYVIETVFSDNMHKCTFYMKMFQVVGRNFTVFAPVTSVFYWKNGSSSWF